MKLNAHILRISFSWSAGNRPINAETLLDIILDSDKAEAYQSNPPNTAEVNTTSIATTETVATTATQSTLNSLKIKTTPTDDGQQSQNKETLHTGSGKVARKQIGKSYVMLLLVVHKCVLSSCVCFESSYKHTRLY